jgi:hypothetical protein
MEAEATVRTTHNGVDAGSPLGAPSPIIEHDKPSHVPTREGSVELKTLLDKYEKMIQGLNSLKADEEAMVQQLEDQRTSRKRTEGAVIVLRGLIEELDPTALQRQGR